MSDSRSDSSSDDSSDEIDDGYGDLHRLVVQAFMAAGYLKASGVKQLFQRAHKQLELEMDEENILEVIKDTVLAINKRICRYNLAIKAADCEITGMKAYMYAVTVESPMMKNQMHFSKFEVEMFKRCLELFLRKSEDFTASSVDCINVSREMEAKGTLVLAESFVEKMLDQQYFIKYSLDETVEMEDYNITLGIRAIRELEPTLMELYADVLVVCGLCKKTMLHGYKCYGGGCGYFVHMPCCKTYIKTAKNCPKCKRVWKSSKMIKRKRDSDEDDNSNSGGRSEADSVEERSDSDTEMQEEETQLTPVPIDMDLSNDGEDQDETLLTPDPDDIDTQLTPVPNNEWPSANNGNGSSGSETENTTEESE